ncbi:MAG: response regulator transcription factor [Gammaproteobacteria bacterium]|nr:LytTR family DNA-binding domain-containing protein [Gammaproteobacteria bacterium]MXW50852.1 response regulator transcription factor [Gammaproteobacteria bacterium]MXY06371.1 response regulator transcription factor [Gammaproteobacteria bacterium]MYE50063.1 response regulator transcription factor [Gammaproteobacteria bacterium]MYE85747.1 response regulator transcription factor [Gammaproteobacteria bacterium]
MTRALILEDEPLLAEQLRDKLQQLWPDLEIVGMALEGREALRLARETQPDIAFMDIRLPGMSGLEVAAALPGHTKVVFVTAHDEFAVEAFRAAAVDYLLKPVSGERLAATIKRLRRDEAQNREELLALLQRIGVGAAPSHLQWIRAGIGDATVLVSVDEVIYFRADAKYTSVMTREREHLVRRAISQLESQLDPDKFWRIHRSLIVRVDQIASARRDLRGRYVLTLRDRPEKLRSSRAYGHLFKPA